MTHSQRLFIASERNATYYFTSKGCNCGDKVAECLDKCSSEDQKQLMEELYSAIEKKRETKKFQEIGEIFHCRCWKVSSEPPGGDYFIRNVRMFDEE